MAHGSICKIGVNGLDRDHEVGESDVFMDKKGKKFKIAF
jgi:hypothetical protein